MDIILVDDEEIIHKSLGSLLSRAGHSVRKATNGLEALHLADQKPPDLIISDIRMPVMDGLELLERSKVRVPGTPVVLITGQGDEETAIAALHRGAHDYLRKPIKLEDLLVLLKGLEERRQTERTLLQERSSWSSSANLRSLTTLAAGLACQLEEPLQGVGDHLQHLFELLDRLRKVGDKRPDIPELIPLLNSLPGLIDPLREGMAHLTHVVRQLQRFACTQTPSEWEEIELADCLEEALAQTEIARRGLSLEKCLQSARVLGKREELIQLFANLLENAAQAIGGRSDGRIAVEISSREAGWIAVAIEDNGEGIADEIADRIFEPFFTTRKLGQRMGLGLSICQRIAIDHGGHLGFSTQPGFGSRFWVRLPQVGNADASRLQFDYPASQEG